MKKEYKSLSKYYDVLHNKKDYSDEVLFFTNLIKKYKKSKGNKLLDVACGTGSHILYFKKNFETEGIDLSKELINITREKNKDVKFRIADMTKFKSSKKFDIITCLFSSIAYLKSVEEIKKTLNNFYNNLNQGGVLLIETFFVKDKLSEIKDHIRQYSDENLKIKRIMNLSIKNDIAQLSAKYEILEKGKSKKYITDKQIIKLYTKSNLISFMEEAGFKVKVLDYKKTGTKIFVGVRK